MGWAPSSCLAWPSPAAFPPPQPAAQAQHRNVSEFLLDAGILAANEALADRRHFVLSEADWAAFQTALDRPVQARPRLKKLLTEPGLLG